MAKIRITLRTKLIAALLMVLIPSNVVLGLRIASLTRANLTESADRALSLMAETIGYQVEEFCEKEFALIEGIAAVPIFRSEAYTLEQKCAQLAHMVELDPRKYENIAFYDVNGFSYSADGVKRDFSKASYFKGAMEGKRWTRPPALNSITNSVLMFFSVPVKTDDGKIVGVMVSVIKGNPFIPILRNMDVGGGMHPSIINLADATFVVDLNSESEGQEGADRELDPDSDIAKTLGKIFAGETGISEFYNPIINMKMVCSYRPLQPYSPFESATPWTIMCIAPYDVYFGHVHDLVRTTIINVAVFVVVGIILGLITIYFIFKPLVSLKKSIVEIASGNADLTKRIPLDSNDEVGDVVEGFNQFTEKLQGIMVGLKHSKEILNQAGDDMGASTQDTTASITQIIANIQSVHGQISNQSDSVNQTAGAVNEIASNIESLEKMIENQSTGIVQASTAVEQMMGNIGSVNNSVDKMANEFTQLASAATDGASLQAEATDKIEKIKKQSETLQDANVAIAAIAEQTNLLAMNAAIEAAHAGEAGKGFSVVADEIRKLSETSGQQSRTIGEHLNSIRESIGQMVLASQQSSNSFQHVADKINETDELVRQIKAAMEEQTAGSKQIGEALRSMNDSTAEVRTASQEMSIGNKAILEEVQHLQNATLEMQNSMEEMSIGATKINETGAALSEITHQMNTAIDEIGIQVDQFKV
ncbi:MAG: methyl-accepting chemotaxis protein [Treponema sp.]|nr:methyl-accepting chemotaxis protein [Treponema sp.]